MVNFAWGPSQRYLYVATSATYGDGGFFKLDLRERTRVRLPVDQASPYETRITGIDLKTNTIKIQVTPRGHDGQQKQTTTEVLPFE